jgi:hypothetical protein
VADVPQYATGGWVHETGLALVHQGEFVLRRDQAQALTAPPPQRGDVARLERLTVNGASAPVRPRQAAGLDAVQTEIQALTRAVAGVPQYAAGGVVDRTGLALIHQGEYVVPVAQRQALAPLLAAVQDAAARPHAAIPLTSEAYVREAPLQPAALLHTPARGAWGDHVVPRLTGTPRSAAGGWDRAPAGDTVYNNHNEITVNVTHTGDRPINGRAIAAEIATQLEQRVRYGQTRLAAAPRPGTATPAGNAWRP